MIIRWTSEVYHRPTNAFALTILEAERRKVAAGGNIQEGRLQRMTIKNIRQMCYSTSGMQQCASCEEAAMFVIKAVHNFLFGTLPACQLRQPASSRSQKTEAEMLASASFAIVTARWSDTVLRS